MPRSRRGAAYYLKYSFTVRDLAELFGVSEAAMRKRLQRKRLDPTDLGAICHAWALANHWAPPSGAKEAPP